MKWFVLVMVAALACHQHGTQKAADAERPTLSETHFSDKTELFVEFPVLVVGKPSKFAAHLTRLSDFRALDKAQVVIELTVAGSVDRVSVDAPRIPGIFGPILTPTRAGKGTLAIIVDGADRHDLGEVTVYANESDVPAEQGDEEPSVAYLKEQQWTRPFRTEPVKKKPFQPIVTANAQLLPRPEGDAHVTAPVAGRLTAPGARVPRLGDEVKQDEPLAFLAPRLSADVDIATLRLQAREAELKLEGAKREQERVTGLAANDAVPERRLQDAKRAEAEAQAAVEASRSRLGQFEGTQRARANDGASRIALRSPISGTIVAADIAPGSFVREGDEVFHVVALDRIWLEAKIAEGDVGAVIETQAGSFTVDGYPGSFSLSSPAAKRIALGGMVNERTRTVPLVFELENPQKALRVGMLARAHLAVGKAEPKLVIPRIAVVTDQGVDVVYVLVDGEHFARRRVTLGQSDGQRVEVRAGLEEGERIVTVGADDVRLAANAGSAPVHGHEH